MAGNTLTNVIPKLLAQGLLALRERAIMPRRVNRDYEGMAAQKGSTINIPLSFDATVRSVSPAVTQAANQDVTNSVIAVTLDQWKESTFHLSDKDMVEAMDGIIPMQASESIKALANTIDSFLLGKYTGIYAAGGTAGTTPLGTDLYQVASCRALLNTGLADAENRTVVLDVNAEANAIANANFIQAERAGTDRTILKGEIGEKLGMDWFLDQNVPTHTNGTAWTSTLTAWKTDVTTAISTGDLTFVVHSASASGTIAVGDLFTIAGDPQQYAMATAVACVSANAATVIAFTPGLAKAYLSGAVMTCVDSHVVNLIFHRDAFVFASRPLVGSVNELGNLISSATDPVSGLSLRLEVSREYKQTTFAYDILYGGKLARPQLAARLMG